jgi:ABC-type spermidine/putrescine transport system permease subunit II
VASAVDSPAPAPVSASSEDRRRGPRKRRRAGERGGLESWLLSAPAVAFVFCFFVAPVFVMLLYSFWPSTDTGQIVHQLSLANYRQFFEQSAYWHTLLTSLWLVGLSAALTVALTLPFAYFVANKVRPSHRIAWILVAVMPFWTSYLVRVFSWINIFGENGAASKALSTAGIADHAPKVLELGKPAIVITFVYLLFPFAFLCSYIALERLDPSLREAGGDLGAKPWQVMRRLTLPLVGAGMLAGFAFSFIAMLGDYVTPQLIGGTEGSLYANLMINQFGASGQWGFGAALAILMMVCLLVLFALLRRVTAANYSSAFTRSYTPSRAPFLRLYSFLFLSFLYLPIGLVVLFALNDAPYVGFPITGLTFKWFEQVLENQEVINAFLTSVKLALTAVGLALLLGVPAAIQLARTKGRLRNLRLVALSLPLLIPPAIIALGILLATKALGIERGYWTLVGGHALLVLPLVVLIVMARLEGLDRSQELAAMDLGAKPARTMFSVVLPQILPAIVAAAMLGLALSLDEFILTLLVTKTTTTLPLYIYSALKFQVDPTLDAIAAMTLLLSFALAILGFWINWRFSARRQQQEQPAPQIRNLLPT